MNPRFWQRQPGESPADFTAFAAYLRLKGRRSPRATAERTGRPLGALRRLSAKYNWPGRVAAFETRLADATQNALDHVIQAAISTSQSDLEQFRIQEFLLAQRVLHESNRWLALAADPRRRQVSILQICRLTELAFKLACLATGMPFGDEPRRRPRPEDRPGYWTGPSMEEALKKIYGAPSPAASPLTAAAAPASRPAPADASGQAGSPPPAAAPTPAPASTAGATPVAAPPSQRRDAWSAWSRSQRQAAARRPT